MCKKHIILPFPGRAPWWRFRPTYVTGKTNARRKYLLLILLRYIDVKMLSAQFQAADAISTGRILECIVELCIQASDWSKLNEYLLVMSKKRGQLKQATTKMVQQACQAIDQTPDKKTKIGLIDTLRTVTAGKVRKSYYFCWLPMSSHKRNRNTGWP